MTCIVAIAQDGEVWMGADSAGVDGLSVMARKDSKIYRVKDFLFGYTSSFRMGQLLGYKFDPPEHPANMPIETYMITLFVDGIRDTLSKGGFASTRDGQEAAGLFLVGYRGRIFRIDCDYQVGESIVNYNAVGCGQELAIGSMYTTDRLSRDIDPHTRCLVALEAAGTYSGGVCGPFNVFKLEKQTKKRREK